MRPRTRWILGIALTIIGTGLVLYGMVSVFLQIASLYQANLSDPLGGSPTREADTAKSMHRPLYIAAIGVIPMLIGNFMLGASVLKALLGRKNKPAAGGRQS